MVFIIIYSGSVIWGIILGLLWVKISEVPKWNYTYIEKEKR